VGMAKGSEVILSDILAIHTGTINLTTVDRNPSVGGRQSAGDDVPSVFPSEERRFSLPAAAGSVTAARWW